MKGDILANTTSIGMHPQEDATPVSASALSSFELVFDAVYTPMDTKLLQVSFSSVPSDASALSHSTHEVLSWVLTGVHHAMTVILNCCCVADAHA